MMLEQAGNTQGRLPMTFHVTGRVAWDVMTCPAQARLGGVASDSGGIRVAADTVPSCLI